MAQILVVDDSLPMRGMVRQILESIGHEVRTARNGEEALELARAALPDLVTLDVNMPGMGGLACLTALRALAPTKVIMVASEPAGGAEATFEALDRGALDFVCKPDPTRGRDQAMMARELKAKVGAALGAAQPAPRPARRERRPAPERMAAPSPGAHETRSRQRLFDPGFPIVLIGASTGGPKALESVLAALPARFPAALLIAQHMPASFTGAFARRLSSKFALPLGEVTGRTAVEPGRIFLARGDADCLLSTTRTHLFAGPAPALPDALWKPSVDRLVESALTCLAPARLFGVLLSGMGTDGAQGFARLHDLGAPVLAQSEESCTVFGMPGRLVELGGANEVLAKEEIGPALCRAVAKAA
ncbi:MAG: chemotaxis-specific protein-glutamate methyltransferase CheB [Pseudomonadota bacterium]